MKKYFSYQHKWHQRFLLLIVLFFQMTAVHAQTEGVVLKYEGNIGKFPVRADVKIIDTVFASRFYFVKDGEPIVMKGSLHHSLIVANEVENDSVIGTFTGELSDDNSLITGSIVSGEKKKKSAVQWKATEPDGSAAINVITKDYKYVWVKNKRGDELGCRSTYSLCYVLQLANESARNKINESLLETDFASGSGHKEFSEAAIEFMDDDFDSYQEDFDTAFSKVNREQHEKFMDASPYIYQWESQQLMDVIFNENNLLSLREYDYEYSGGAHGNYSYANTVFNLKTGEQLQLSDLFKTGFKLQLDNLAQLQLLNKYKAGSLQQLNEKGFLLQNGFSASDNFFIQENGIGFTYNPYEIASYANGVIEVVIPWSQLQQLIRPDGPLAWALMK